MWTTSRRCVMCIRAMRGRAVTHHMRATGLDAAAGCYGNEQQQHQQQLKHQ